MSKVSKLRACPAAGREMTPAECGEGRGSRFACPPECGFNPFSPANYDELLRLEEKVDELALQWLERHSPDRAALERDLWQASSPGASLHALHATIVWRIYFEKDAGGMTCAQRWEEAGFPGLKNDARVLMRAKMNIRMALIEVRQVFDKERTEVVDLLCAQPRPSIVTDRGLASIAARFATAVTWVYSLPHFDRLFGSAIVLRQIPGFEPREVVEEIVRHLGGPLEEAGMRLWLAEHLTHFDQTLSAVGLERQRRMFEGIDARFGKAVYELRSPFAECRERLDGSPDVDEDEPEDNERSEGFAEARVWFGGEGDSESAPEGLISRPVLGRVLMGQAYWRLEAMGGKRLAALRRRYEALMGKRVRFAGERQDDLGMGLMDKQPRADLRMVPPRLLENTEMISLGSSRVLVHLGDRSPEEIEKELRAANDRAFLDTAVPALGGKTPREAARDPKLRPKLVRLMKERVRSADECNLKTGSNDDVNWMLIALGLVEIFFDPPPAGRVPRYGAMEEFLDEDDEDEAEFEDIDEHIALPMDAALPPAPRLPRRPFTEDEVCERLGALFGAEGAEIEKAMEALEAGGCTLLDDVDVVTEGLVDDRGFSLLAGLLVPTWCVFAPPGTRGPNLSRAVLREAIEREAEQVLDTAGLKSPAALDDFFNRSPQPELARAMVSLVITWGESMPRKARPSREQRAIVSAVLRAVIAELDRAHRRV